MSHFNLNKKHTFRWIICRYKKKVMQSLKMTASMLQSKHKQPMILHFFSRNFHDWFWINSTFLAQPIPACCRKSFVKGWLTRNQNWISFDKIQILHCIQQKHSKSWSCTYTFRILFIEWLVSHFVHFVECDKHFDSVLIKSERKF